MIRSLTVKHFTVYKSHHFRFANQLNVILGENGSGKSHLLKLLYSVASANQEVACSTFASKEELQKTVANTLLDVFQPDTLGGLVTRQQGRKRAEVQVEFRAPRASFGFWFSTNSTMEVQVDPAPQQHQVGSVIFFSTQEMLSVFPGFAAHQGCELGFDRTCCDLALALQHAPLKGHKGIQKQLIEQLEEVVGGRVSLEGGKFYLTSKGAGKLEVTLVAGGMRKMAMLLYLLMNGQLRTGSMLLWDGPEISMNPRLIRQLARVLLLLSDAGVQVVVATHSLFLLRELHLQMEVPGAKRVQTHHFNLKRGEKGTVEVSAAESIEDLDDPVVLEETVRQSEAYLSLDV